MSALQQQLTTTSAVTGGRWLEPLRDWPIGILRALVSEPCIARVVVASIRGSAPREPGVCMLVMRDRICGTIGGGRLEQVAIDAAHALLAGAGAATAQLHRFVLGPELAQCCGGVVELWIERYARSDVPTLSAIAAAWHHQNASLQTVLRADVVERRILRALSGKQQERCTLQRASDQVQLHEPLARPLAEVWLYGAGHVGQALVRILADLPVRVTWIDARAELLPADVSVPVQVIHAIDPAATLTMSPRHAHVLVMTHSHALDYALCRAALERDGYASVGVIGSASKAARFRSRLLRDGVDAARVAHLICPIGVDGISNKSPAAIAISVAAQLLQKLEVHAALSAIASVPPVGCTSARDGAACAGCAATL